MQALENNALFTEVSAEESAIVSGGDGIIASVNLAQIVFAYGAYTWTLATGGGPALAFEVLKDQYLQAFNTLVGP